MNLEAHKESGIKGVLSFMSPFGVFHSGFLL